MGWEKYLRPWEPSVTLHTRFENRITQSDDCTFEYLEQNIVLSLTVPVTFFKVILQHIFFFPGEGIIQGEMDNRE